MKSVLAFIFAFLLLSSCYKDQVVDSVEQFPSYPEVVIEKANVIVICKSENGALLESPESSFASQVSVGKSVSFFDPVNFSAIGEVVTIHHELGFDLHYPLLNQANQKNIHKVVVPDIEDSFLATKEEAHTIPFLNNSELSININGITDISSQQFVSPTVWYRNFSADNFDLIPMGITNTEFLERGFLMFDAVSFIAIGTKDQEYILQDFNITEDIQDEMYFFDASVDQWVKYNLSEGITTGFYASGKVSPAHISEVRLSAAHDLEQLEFIVFSNGQKFSRQIITQQNSVLLYTPAESTISYEIRSMNEVIGAGTFDIRQTEVVELPVNLSSDDAHTLKYELVDCNFETVNNAYFTVKKDDVEYVYASAGSNELTIFHKPTDRISVQFYSSDAGFTSEPVLFRTAPIYNLHRQFLCPGIGSDYIVLDAKEDSYLFQDPSYQSISDGRVIQAVSGSDEFTLKIKKLSKGSLEDMDVNIFLNAPSVASGYRLNCLESEAGCGFSRFELTSYEEEAGYFVKGTFEGLFWIESFQEGNVGYRNLSGEFQIEVK